MLTGNRLLFFCIATLLAIVLFFFLFPNREKEVKKQLNRLSAAASVQLDEPPLTSLKKAARIDKLFAGTCTLSAQRPAINSSFNRKEIMDRISMAKRVFTWLEVSFYDITVQFQSDSEAEALLTMRLLGKRGDQDFADVQEARFTLEEVDRKWLINGVELIEVLEK